MFQTDFANSEFSPVVTDFTPFFTQKPKSWSPNIQICSQKVVYRFMYIKDTENYLELEIKHHFTKITIWPFFHENLQEQHKFTSSSMIMITYGINHQQQHLITTTNHEFIINSSTTQSTSKSHTQTLHQSISTNFTN